MDEQLPQVDSGDTNPLQQWQRHGLWRKTLNTTFMDLLEGDSAISRAYPHLHEAFWSRFNEAMDARNGESVSKCNELYPDGRTGRLSRADSILYQRNHGDDNETPEYEDGSPDSTEARGRRICARLRDRMHIRAAIGSGSYGSVFLAIEKHATNPELDRHYVVKVENHHTMRYRFDRQAQFPTMTAIPDEDEDVKFIPLEALLLLLTTPSPRFPNLDSVYVDAAVHSTAMGACVDHDILKIPELDLEGKSPPTFRGRYLNNKNTPLVNELESCKIASQLLEGFIYLWDMNVTHSDLSQNNFLIDEELNVSIIDMGMMQFGFSSYDFKVGAWSLVGLIESMITPEMAIELTKDDWRRLELRPGREQVDMYLPHNAAIDDFWRLSCTIFNVLHGHAPWQSPDWYSHVPLPGYGSVENVEGEYEKMIFERRHRVINEEPPINENLSQDCVDALRMILKKEPLERPSPLEMCAMPWFNQHAPYTEHMPFLRPQSLLYEQDKKKRGFRKVRTNRPRPEEQ